MRRAVWLLVWGRVVLPFMVTSSCCGGLCGEGGFAIDENVMMSAASGGNLKLVQLLIQEEGFGMDVQLMAYAASSGNLELVKWLRSKGCPWDSRTCFIAVEYSHVEVLRWVREHGCLWRAEARDRAAALGYTDNFGNLVWD